MSELIFELLLRLLKVAAAGATLGVASFAAGAGVILLLESSPL